MNFLNAFSKHKIVEINKSFGLLAGHMLAQTPYIAEVGETFLDNGHILFLSEENTLVKNPADGAGPRPFLHFTEELMTIGIVSGYEYFTLDIENGKAFPRAIALYEGDEFTTNNYALNTGVVPVKGTKYYAQANEAGVLVVYDAPPITPGPLFLAELDRLPAGQVAMHFTVLRVA